MFVLIGCECSGVVRDAFRKRGHEAYSCDLLPNSSPYHLQCDLLGLLAEEYPWDLGIFHPPCTHLAVSGARHFEAKRADGRQQEAIEFFMECIACNIQRVCVENPVGIMSTIYKKPEAPDGQIIQPWKFGHPENKKTCLWLKNLPLLVPTNDVQEEMKALPAAVRNRIHHMPPSSTRAQERSKTYFGIAEAMAEQWGGL